MRTSDKSRTGGNKLQLGDLTSKKCLITGGTKGIGEATAKLFEQLGAEKVLIIGRDKQRGERIERESKVITYKQADLEDLDSVREFLDWFKSDFGKLDILISNASRDSRFTILDITMEEWERMVKLNLTSPYLICKSVAQKMIHDKIKGKIILVGAIQALYPLERSFGYVTTKGGVISMIKSMASDLGKYGIQVLGVLPGPIYIKEGEVPAPLDQRAAPLLERMGRKEEVAKVLAFLASDDNSFMTGNYVIVDGGRIISRKPDPVEISESS